MKNIAGNKYIATLQTSSQTKTGSGNDISPDQKVILAFYKGTIQRRKIKKCLNLDSFFLVGGSEVIETLLFHA